MLRFKNSSFVRFLPVLAVAMVSFGLSACEALPKSDPQIVASPDRVTLRLAEAADRATKAMETLAEVEQAKSPTPIAQRLDDVPPELKRTVTIAWTGPVAPLAKAMADRASYRFIELGSAPPVPVVVHVDVINRSVIDVLRDIGLQMGARGSVVVDAANRTVEVNYATASH